MSVKSTYNFVPAPNENEVFKPDWANQISHDIPFSDGESGEIELCITAKAPIYIRNGHSQTLANQYKKIIKGGGPSNKEEKEILDEVLSFSNFKNKNGYKQFFIPASSIKGMVRNVVEILTRSRMKKVNDHHHAVRQIMKTQKTVVDEGYELSKGEKKNIRAGWLIQRGEEHFIVDCGKPLKIRYTDIDAELGTSFVEQFGGQLKSNIDSDFSARTAKYKYENVLKGDDRQYLFEDHPLDEEGQESWVSIFQPLKYVQFSGDELGGFYGTIVCVGQASKYTVSTSRKGEYVFKGSKVELLNNQKGIKVSNEVYETFKFINRHNHPEELEDWGYWKDKIKDGIPVFFRKKEDGKNVKDFGLSFMYKQPANFKVKESYPLKTYINEEKEGYQLDWAETIFGNTINGKPLKGRVFFSNILSEKDATELKERSVVFSSPRSSYFPTYLKQEGKNSRNGKTNKYNTYNNNPTLAGFKRYPVKRIITKMDVTEMNVDMITSFKPLPKETKFYGKVRFHNLRKSEIGALISALTFHKKEGDFYHSLGYAKSLGYGKIKLNINTKKLEFSDEDYLKSFEFQLTKNGDNWNNESYINEFLAMATYALEHVEPLLTSMELKDFQEVKNKGLYLQSYAKISNANHSFDKYLSAAEKESFLKNEQQEEFEKQKKQQEKLLTIQNEKDALENEIFHQALNINTIQSLKDFINKHPKSKLIDSANSQIKLLKEEDKKSEAVAAADEKFTADSYRFDDIKKWPNKKLENPHFKFTETQIHDIEKAIIKCFELESENPKNRKNKFFKKGKLNTFPKFPWNNIISWIGEEQATELFIKFSK